ncbi:MAG TPA: hypothetical protein VLL52_18245 [Anaerolineae bacterium]|nr:hypothetical protein [Anaerolineae bacterium]
MDIQRMRGYFLYNIPVTEQLFPNKDEEEHRIGVTPAFVKEFERVFDVKAAPIPAFYTSHYRVEHTPYLVTSGKSQKTYVSAAKLREIPFYAELGLTEDISLKWEFMLALYTTGLISLQVEIKERMKSRLAYRLSGLHLNPHYRVIATGPVAYLWENGGTTRPEFVTPDELAQAIRGYFFGRVGVPVRRVQALRHEIQIPFTAIEVNTDCETQTEFVEKHAKDIAEMVFKPACWEVENASMIHARSVLEPQRVWSVAQDTYVVIAYEGALYIKIKTFDTGVPHEVSGFHVADESSVLHSFRLAVSNYHLLRILDDLLDTEMDRLTGVVSRQQKALRIASQDPQIESYGILTQMNEFVVKVTNLQFHLVDLMEEMDNSDKLIDEEWHIVLLDRLNDALGTKMWRDSVNARVHNLHQLVETVEHTYQRFVNLEVNQQIADFNAQLLQMHIDSQQVDNRLKWVGYLFSVLAVAEVISLLIDVGFDDSNPVVLWLIQRYGMSVVQGHLVVVGVVIGIMLSMFMGIIWWERRS